MPTTTTPSEHLSIGEVLATLRDEFPDITISKIRFLESQGLIDPERTPSGYRKFYGPDIERLRWILHQQKENFLPLKVIKGRLEDAGPDALPADVAADPHPRKPTGGKTAKSARRRGKAATKDHATSAPGRAGAGAETTTAGAQGDGRRPPKPKARRPSDDMPTLALDDGVEDDLEPSDDGGSLTRAELAAASGLTDAQIAELEEFGLLEPAGTGGDRILFDDDALAVAALAAGFRSTASKPATCGCTAASPSAKPRCTAR